MESLRRPFPLALAAGAAAAYAWWVVGLRPFTTPALVGVGAAGVLVIALGSRRRRPPGTGASDAAAVLLWGVLVLLLAGWELAAYVQHPRADHPTLSSLANDVLDRRPLRALAFLVWLAAGAGIARR